MSSSVLRVPRWANRNALPPFNTVSESVFRDVTAGAFLQKFPAGTTLLNEGDPVDFLYVLLDGFVPNYIELVCS